jgi:glycosyltransferase involved in cell wall biosynthesis
MLTPIFSIITPTYNCAEFILRSYKFLDAQTEKSWEWIIVDDGSTDHTKAVVDSIKDERIIFLTYVNNQGRGYARNLGLKNTKGAIIVIWDVDDIYFPNRLEAIKNNIKNYDFFVSKAIVVDNNLNIKGIRGFNKNQLYTGFVHPTLAFTSVIKNKINYDETMTAGEDLESMIFLTNNCNGFFYAEPLMLYVEDREVNLNKSLISNTSHLKTIKKTYYLKITKINFYNYFLSVIKLKIKIYILKIFNFYPKLYFLTVKYRNIENNQKEYSRFISDVSKIKIQLGT